MDVDNWKPDPRVPIQPARPVSSVRLMARYGLLSLAGFLLTVAVLARHEIVDYMAHRAAKSDLSRETVATEQPAAEWHGNTATYHYDDNLIGNMTEHSEATVPSNDDSGPQSHARPKPLPSLAATKEIPPPQPDPPRERVYP
jgi:hypothetical protein